MVVHAHTLLCCAVLCCVVLCFAVPYDAGATHMHTCTHAHTHTRTHSAVRRAMQVGSYPDTQNAPILAGLLRDVLLGAPHCLGEQAAEGSTLAMARVLGAAVCAAPEVVESMDAAGGGEGERLRGLLLSLSSQPDRRCLEELAPAWAALTPLNAAPGHAASWQQLAEVRLQPHVLEAATPCIRSRELTHWKRRPYAPEAATPMPSGAVAAEHPARGRRGGRAGAGLGRGGRRGGG